MSTVESVNFFVHFDVQNHQIPIEQSIATDQAIKDIIEEITKHLYSNSIEIAVTTFPLLPGSQKRKYGLTPLRIMGTLIVAGQSGVLDGISLSVNGRDIKTNTHEAIETIKQTSKTFFESKTEPLLNSELGSDTLCRAYEAKNKFYSAAIQNLNLRSIGFDESEQFPIKRERNGFHDRLNLTISNSKFDDSFERIHNLTIVSQINSKQEETLAWQVRDSSGSGAHQVYMKDEIFYAIYWDNDLKLKNIKAKIRYKIELDPLTGKLGYKEKGKEIIEVYSYNNEIIKEYDGLITPFPPDLNDENFFTSFTKKETDQASLFVD